MITPGNAKQEQITSIVNSDRTSIKNSTQFMNNPDVIDYFNNFKVEQNKKSNIWHVMMLSFESIVFMGLFMYLFSVKIFLQSLFMPVAGLSAVFVTLLVVHMLSMIKNRKIT